MKKLLAILALTILATGCSQIDTGNVGVESTLGQVKKETMPPGMYFTLFKRVTEVSAKELRLSLDDLKPQTVDKINLADLDVDIYVQIDPAHAPDIMTRWPGDLTQEKGEDGARLGINYVTRQAREAIYSDIAKRQSATVHTERASIAENVVKALQADLDASAGKGWFFVRSANIRNMQTDPTLEAAVKESATRQFQINAKTKELELAKLEADRKRVEAAGDADATKLRAAAVSAQGGSEYIQLQAIAKWDGKLPTTHAGGNMPFINLK